MNLLLTVSCYFPVIKFSLSQSEHAHVAMATVQLLSHRRNEVSGASLLLHQQ